MAGGRLMTLRGDNVATIRATILASFAAGALALKGYAILSLTIAARGPKAIQSITYRLPGQEAAAGTIVLIKGDGAAIIDALIDAIGDLPDGDIGAAIGAQLAYLGLA